MVGDAHTVLVGMGEAKLKSTKEARTARDGSAHEVEFTKDPLPCLDADTLLATEVIKDGKNPCFMAVSEFQGALGGVEHPAQDFLSLCPTPISFWHLLFGDSFLPVVWSVISGLCEHAVHGMQNTAVDVLTK